jgi:hypothetical protein
MSDMTIAASAGAVEQLFDAARDHFTFTKSDGGSFGPFSASYSVKLHLQEGSLTLHDDDTIEVQDLEIVWDTLKLTVCFDPLPNWCVGGFCIVPDPWNGCLVSFPGFCLPGPICAPLDLSGVVSEISELRARFVTKYYVDPARLPGWTDLDAELNGHPNQWRLFLDPTYVLIDPIDFPATVANLLENAIEDAINNLIPSWVPDVAKDILWAIIGPILSAVEDTLGIVGDVEDWLWHVLADLFTLPALIETAIADYFAEQNPIHLFDDPFKIMDAEPNLIPVKIPIRNLAATVNSHELVLRADVGP